jgi:methyl-accepting chemotaxis protein
MLVQAPDTVFIATPRDALSVAADWALVVVAATIVVTALVALVIMLRTSRSLQRVGRAATRKADPLLDRGKSVAANVEFITATLRTDVEGLHSSIRSLSDRLKQASDHMEHRIEEFNALMEVVQGEAEDVFIDTASTARGVRAGARQLVRPSGTAVRSTTEVAATTDDAGSEPSD